MAHALIQPPPAAATTPTRRAGLSRMLAVTLGPLALPLPPLLLLAAVVVAQGLAALLAKRQRRHDAHTLSDAAGRAALAARAGDAFTTAALLGLLAARLAYVAVHAGAYAAAPLSVFDVRDGGWHSGAGFAAGLAWLAWRGLRAAPLRPALAAGATVGMLLWFGLSAAFGPREGAVLPDMPLVDQVHGGAPVTLAQAAQGRPAVVVLWASWCAPCREEMPLLAAAQQREAGVRFLFVNQGESAPVVQRYLAGLPYAVRHVLRDEGSLLGPAVGSPGLPTTLFYDARGRQVDAHFGVLNAAALESRLWPLRGGPGDRALHAPTR